MEYQLLALDMDGTVLASDKTITPRTQAAIHRALAAGKEVLFATGRAPAEMREHLKNFPDMHYVICLAGATVVDLRTHRDLNVVRFSRETAQAIYSVGSRYDTLCAVYAGEDVYIERRHLGNQSYFGCQCFAKLYEQSGKWVEDIRDVIREHGDDIRKINFYFHSPEEYAAAEPFLRPLPVSYASGIPNNYEISPAGVDKGVGLTALCESLGIPMEAAIAVGDEGNDLAMIRCAGLGVAMGNATEVVKAAAQAITADCDHDGVAEVIEKYLLKE